MPKKRGGGQSKSLTLEVLSANFHLPINDVAHKLGLCVTVLKQRCREHGITRWPYRKVKKLDNIIHALDGDGARSHDRLESVIKTRESLITDPNSKAHLRVGKLKTVKAARRRGGKLAAAADSRARGEQRTTPEEDHFSDGSGDTSADAGSGGSGGSSGTAFARAPVAKPRPSAAGVGDLLEAAASLSDGEPPGTPTREGPDDLRERSPRMSGLLSAISSGEEMGAGSALRDAAAALRALNTPGAGAGAGAGGVGSGPGAFQPAAPGGAFQPAAPGGAFQQPAPAADAQSPPRPAVPAAPPPAATPLACLDPATLAAAVAALTRAAAAPAPQAPPPPPPPAAAPWNAAAMAQMNQNTLLAWMTAVGGAAAQQNAFASAPAPPSWDPAAAMQQLARLQRSAAAADAGDAAAPAGGGSAHQPL